MNHGLANYKHLRSLETFVSLSRLCDKLSQSLDSIGCKQVSN